MPRRWLASIILCSLLAWIPSPALAEPHIARVPLREGMLHVDDLVSVLGAQVGIDLDCPLKGRVDLSSLQGNLFIRAMNRSLGDGCRLSIAPDALVLHINPARLPRTSRQARAAVRVFTATAAPEGSADQARLYGLLLPVEMDEDRPLVVLVHGLDCTRQQWWAIAQLLEDEGHQVAYFTFPSDQPLADSADLLGLHLRALAETFPAMDISLLTYSMGGLVARGYVEGQAFGGEVDRLIMLAPPNHGSSWASYRTLLEVEEHWRLWRGHHDWRWTWAITDGLGEAGGDLKPHSAFLAELNHRERRADVAYTIIAGNRHPMRRIAADCIEAPARWIPQPAGNWWGVRQTGSWLRNTAQRLRAQPDRSDGPVTINSARLSGVEDFVLLPADHVMLYQPAGSNPPVAWATIRDRLRP